MGQSQITLMTREQLKEFAKEVAEYAVKDTTRPQDAETNNKRYVFGLRGISELFNVSHPTAQRYKNTFLAPAIMQRGRKIVVDVAKALELYNSREL